MRVLASVFSLLFVTSVLAAELEKAPAEVVPNLYHGWEKVRYQTPEKQQEIGYQKLKDQADQQLAHFPNDPNLLIWKGIITSTYAGAAGGLSALSLVKEARASFEKALSLDPTAFQGSAYTSLGSLYYQVPGWPLSFGDDDKAEEMLKKGLKLNPDGLDSNYFYGDFLARQKRYGEARQYLQKALQAPPRPDRPLADSGRRGEVRKLLDSLPGTGQ